MKPLTVNCTITWQDCSSEPTVTWCKLLINNDCVKVNSTPDVAIHQERSLTEGNKIVSYLNFHRVEKHDDGLYRCEISGSLTVVSHTINVSVSGKSNDPTVFTWCATSNYYQWFKTSWFKLCVTKWPLTSNMNISEWIWICIRLSLTVKVGFNLCFVLVCPLYTFVLTSLWRQKPCTVPQVSATFYVITI